ncbi:MAG: nucleotidyltransferase family protein [Chloroflexota bacterium]
MSDKIVALVLAAGESRRMGEPKQLLPWGDHTIIEQIIGTLLQSPVDEIVVVLGHRADEVVAKLPNPKPVLSAVEGSQIPNPNVQHVPTVRAIVNPHYRDGMLSSIQFGVASLAADVRAAFIVLCDQPQMKATTVTILRSAFEQAGNGIVVPSHQMRRGHPLLLDVRKYRAEILAIDGAPGLQTILRDHPDDILHVPFDDDSVLADVDTKEDYQRAIANVKYTI